MCVSSNTKETVGLQICKIKVCIMCVKQQTATTDKGQTVLVATNN
jgi:hypothetical protein